MVKFQTMSTWAVILTGGKQYKVQEGMPLVIEKLETPNETEVTFDKVLLIGGDKVAVGTPYVDKAKVKAKVLDTFRDEKIRVVKFKSKSRYMRTNGHRQTKTKVLIEKIFAA